MKRSINHVLSTLMGGLLIFSQGCKPDSNRKEAANAEAALVVEARQEEPKALETAPQPEQPDFGSLPKQGTNSHNTSDWFSGREDRSDSFGSNLHHSSQSDPSPQDDDLADPLARDDDDHFGGICGNGIQEVIDNDDDGDGNYCDHWLYGVTIAQPNGGSTLYHFKINYIAEPIGTITNIHNVSAIDFSPQGTLYAIGESNTAVGNIAPGQSVLARLNCVTGSAHIIGATNIANDSFVSDMSFDWQGQLVAFVQGPTPDQDYVGTVDLATGAISALPPTGEDDFLGNGITFWPFTINELYHADEDDLSTISLITGLETDVSDLTYLPPLTSSARINAMDLDPGRGILYASIEQDSKSTNVLGILKVSNATVKRIFTAPKGLDAIAVNRLYEECDTTDENCVDCLIVETLCDDGIDNDFDGLIDCADHNCINQTCDDNNPCTFNDSCAFVSPDEPLVCQGEPVICNDDNPCTTDVCLSLGAQGGVVNPNCVFTNNLELTNFGDCEIDGDSCTIGKCVLQDPDNQNSPYECFEQNRVFIDDPNESCKDDNQCTADSCIVTCQSPETELPLHLSAAPASCNSTDLKDEDGNVVLENSWQCANEIIENALCFVENECTPGICTILTEPELSASCEALPEADPVGRCPEDQDGNQCTETICDVELGCIEVPVDPGLDCSLGEQCIAFTVCDGEGNCVGDTEFKNGAECDDGNECTANDVCNHGDCQEGTPLSDTPCGFESFCNAFICQAGQCVPDVEALSPCDDSNPCTVDSCDDVNGCFHDALADNTPAGGPCTVPGEQGICADGAFVCIGGEVSDRCARLYVPQPSNPNNGLDNDCDGAIDNDDLPVCTDEVCNSLDDDCDGLIDNLAEGECKKLVFLSGSAYTGNLGGVTGADAKCQLEANSIPALTGKTFRAWISTSTYSPAFSDAFHASGPYTLVDGTTVVVNSGGDLFLTESTSTDLLHAIDTNQYGIGGALVGVWTGTDPGGSFLAPNCNDWTSSSSEDSGLYGVSASTDPTWTDNDFTFPCDTPFFRLYCFEQ